MLTGYQPIWGYFMLRYCTFVHQCSGRLGFNPRSSHTKDFFKKWYLIPPCSTLSIIKYGSRVKWSNSRKVVAPSPTSRCSSYWKGSLLFALDYGRQLYFTIFTSYIYLFFRGEGLIVIWYRIFQSNTNNLHTVL